MAKLLIVDDRERSRVPFLRGILTRRLQGAGLSFDDAYQVASRVREALLASDHEGPTEVTTQALVAAVVEHLEPFGAEIVQRYRQRPTVGRVLLRAPDGRTEPFSRRRLRLSLQASGLGADESIRIAEEIHEGLLGRGVREVTAAEIEEQTHARLGDELGADAARRYRVWIAHERSERPLIVLLGGAPGSGKSTIATRVAHTLDIERTQSTDMLREVMRAMVPPRLVPVLHASSFTAWQALPAGTLEGDEQARVVAGYLSQMELLSLACEAVVQRALSERLSIILEGVHIHSSLLGRIRPDGDAVVVPLMLAVLKPTVLRQRLEGRGGRITERRSQRYLENFDSIWRIQEFLLSEADAAQVPIIANEDRDGTVQQVMLSVIHALERATPAAEPLP